MAVVLYILRNAPSSTSFCQFRVCRIVCRANRDDAVNLFLVDLFGRQEQAGYPPAFFSIIAHFAHNIANAGKAVGIVPWLIMVTPGSVCGSSTQCSVFYIFANSCFYRVTSGRKMEPVLSTIIVCRSHNNAPPATQLPITATAGCPRVAHNGVVYGKIRPKCSLSGNVSSCMGR